MEKLLELWHTALGKVIACLLAIALAFMGWNIAMIMGAFGSDNDQETTAQNVATDGDESSTPESADESSSEDDSAADDNGSAAVPAEKGSSSEKEASSSSAAVSADEDATLKIPANIEVYDKGGNKLEGAVKVDPSKKQTIYVAASKAGEQVDEVTIAGTKKDLVDENAKVPAAAADAAGGDVVLVPVEIPAANLEPGETAKIDASTEEVPADENTGAEGDKAQGTASDKDSAVVDGDESKDAAEGSDEKVDASKDSEKAEAKDEQKTEQPKVDNEGVVAKGVDAPAYEGYAYVTKGAVFGIFGGTQVTVKVSAGEGVVPEGTAVEATLIDPSEYAQALEDAGLESATATLVDINLVYKGNYIQPNGAVNVSIFDPDVALPAEGGELQVVHIADTAADHEAVDASQIINPAGSESSDEPAADESASSESAAASEPEAITVETRQADESCVSFDTEHFSIYAVAYSAKTVTINATVKDAVVKMVVGNVAGFAGDGRPNVEGAAWADAVDAQEAGTFPLNQDTAFLFFVKGDNKSLITSFSTQGDGKNVNVFPLTKQKHWHGIDQLCADAGAEGYIAYFGYTFRMSKANATNLVNVSVAGTTPALDASIELSKADNLVPGEKVDVTVTVAPQKTVNGVSFDVKKPKLTSLTIGGRSVDVSDLELVETGEGTGVYKAVYKDYPVSLDDVQGGFISVKAEAKTQYDYGMTLGSGSGDKTDIVTTTTLDGSASAIATVAPKAGVSYAYSYQDGMRPSADIENAMLAQLPAGSSDVYGEIVVADDPVETKYHDSELHGTWSYEGWKKNGEGEVLSPGASLPVSAGESTIYIVGHWSFVPDHVVTWISEGATVETQYYWDEDGHKSLSVPADPSKDMGDGYDCTFTGWVDGSGNAAPAAGTEVTADATYYAQFSSVYVPKLTIKYVDEDGAAMKGVDTYTKRLRTGKAYEVASPQVKGYDASPWVVAGEMGTTDVEVTVVYHHKKPVSAQHILTVRYVYADGTEAAGTHTEALAEGKDFEVASPLIEGYDADKPVVAGTMGSSDYEVVVTYTAKTPVAVGHILTIHYVYADGTKAAEDYQGAFNEGDDYAVNSPVIDGYDADMPVVGGKMEGADKTVTVTYKAKAPVVTAHFLTIHYVKADGTKVAEDHTATLDEGDSFDVTSPAVEGHKPSFTKIGGKMPGHDIEFTVVYTAVVPSPGTNPNPGTTDPGTDNPGTNPGGGDNPGTNPGGTDNPGTTDPGTNPGGTDNPGTNPGGGDNPGTTDPGTNPGGGTDNPGDNPGAGDNGNAGNSGNNGGGNSGSNVTPSRPGTTAIVIPGGTSNPVYPIVQTLGTPVAVSDSPNPLAGNAADDEGDVTFIDDDGNPLMTVDSCWVHFYMIIGLILTALYGLGVIGRRRAYAGSVNKLVDSVVNKKNEQ